MRILSWNVHGWLTMNHQPNLQMVADLLRQADADVIGLNEVYHPAPMEEGIALDWLAAELSMSYSFSACEAWPFEATSTASGYGNALLSRHPIVSTSASLFPTDSANEIRRGCIECEIDVGEEIPLCVVVTHLDHVSENVRLRQFQDFPGGLDDLASRVDVILGDFNCIHPRDFEDRTDGLERLRQHPIANHVVNVPDGPLVTQLMEQTGFVDAFVHQEVLGVNTFIPSEEAVRYDYVWVSQNVIVRLENVEVVDEPMGEEASDHRPVLVDLRKN